MNHGSEMEAGWGGMHRPGTRGQPRRDSKSITSTWKAEKENGKQSQQSQQEGNCKPREESGLAYPAVISISHIQEMLAQYVNKSTSVQHKGNQQMDELSAMDWKGTDELERPIAYEAGGNQQLGSMRVESKWRRLRGRGVVGEDMA